MSEKKPLPDIDEAEFRKERACLMCQAKFASLWAGERVCQRCKSSGTWRAGVQWATGKNAS